MLFSYIWPIDRILTFDATQGQRGPWSDGNEGVFLILQSSSIIGIPSSDFLVSYPGHTLREKQSVHSTATTDEKMYEIMGLTLFRNVLV